MSNYYEIKTIYLEPVEESDEFKKVTKSYLVTAVSVTDAEATIISWSPSNFRDFQVESVKKTNLLEINFNSNQEDGEFFKVKILDDDDGRIAKPKPIEVMIEANGLLDATQKAMENWINCSIEKVERYKGIVDEELASEEPTNQEG